MFPLKDPNPRPCGLKSVHCYQEGRALINLF